MKWYNLALMGPTTPDLAKKLGIKPGKRVCLLDAPAEAEQAIREAAPWAIFSTRLDEARVARYDVILFWPRQLEDLVDLFADLQRRIVPDGSIWAVIPKQKFAARRGWFLTGSRCRLLACKPTWWTIKWPPSLSRITPHVLLSVRKGVDVYRAMLLCLRI